MYILVTLVILLILFAMFVLNLPVFGAKPKGERLQRIMNLPLYKNGALQNQSLTPALPPDLSYFTILKRVIKGNKNGSPTQTLPHLIPSLENSDQLKITWFGHSTYFIQVDSLNILVDPVFSERPSPFQFMGTKRFKGTDIIKPADFPSLDLILITHDHYDHLDYHAILALKDKTKHFITSLGVGAHLEHWGVKSDQISELAWGEQCATFADLKFTALPSRHFSGRGFKRNQTLWSSFVLQTKNHNLYLGGDSGYDTHFKMIGEQYGPFDLAILECGQYNTMWPLIHLFPEYVAQAGIDLKADRIMPVHWAKYKLALHDWNESIERLIKAATEKKLEVITPMLGQSFTLDDKLPTETWWRNL